MSRKLTAAEKEARQRQRERDEAERERVRQRETFADDAWTNAYRANCIGPAYRRRGRTPIEDDGSLGFDRAVRAYEELE